MIKHIEFFWLVLLGALWGMTIPMIKIATSTGYQPMGLIAWQLIIAIIMLAVYCFKQGYSLRVNARQLVFAGVVGLLGTLLPNWVSYISVPHLPAGVYAIIIASVPMFVLPIALLCHLETMQWRRIMGVVIGAVAVILLLAPSTSLPDPRQTGFVLLALLAPFFYGLEANYVARFNDPRVPPALVLFLGSLILFILVLPLTLYSGQWINPFAEFSAVDQALLVTGPLHVIAYVGYLGLVNRNGAVFASQIAYVVTLLGVVFSLWILDESYSPWIWAALVLMIVGLALVQPKRSEQTV